ncbi:peroxiredoxin family protein [Kaarinaea lacus]
MFKKLNLLGFLLLLIFSASLSVANEESGKFYGNETEISQYAGKGKWLVVMIWASDCSVCNKEAHNYIDFHKQRKDKDAQVVGLSMDGKEKSKDALEFIKRHKVNFPNLIGEPMDVATMYQERTGGNWIGTPSFMVFNPKGELVGAQAGAVPVSIIESFIERESAASPPKS